MKLRLVRLNPLTLDPGEFCLMGVRQMAANPVTGQGTQIVQFPVRLEYLCYQAEDGRMLLEEDAVWKPVEFINEFAQPDKSDNARKVRSEVQVPVYNGSSRNKRRGGDSGGKPS